MPRSTSGICMRQSRKTGMKETARTWSLCAPKSLRRSKRCCLPRGGLGLSVVLNEESGRISTLWRWMDLEELQSYEDGTFQSRVENDGGRRGYKAFSMGENPYARERPVAVSVPIDWAVRSAIKTASYTALPRPLQPSAERIGDEKHVRYARETECRVPDGVRVPRGTRMRVDIAKLRRDTDMARLRSVCRSLESVADVSFI